ncbi:MAG: AgmX/PglI C-terminal domain-containing protein [Deltaproteobacteria bacterium]|nr:AgmX/PglI C-terminal domain-containing protein [Deltaproteobacteria bacterium]
MSQAIGLEITTDGGARRLAEFATDSILVGSGPSAVLRLEEAGVSSIHAVIKLSPTGVATVIDLGSEAGTSVNGEVIGEPAELRLGDQIGLGQAVLRVMMLGGARWSEDETVRAPSAVSARVDPAADLAEPPTEVMDAAPEEMLAAGAAALHAAHRISELEPVDLRLLAAPLPEENRPTRDQCALQISVLWGSEIVDTVMVSDARAVTVGGRDNGSWWSKNFAARRAFDLEIDAPLPAETFTLAINRGTEAQIIVPDAADVALRKEDGSVAKTLSLSPTDSVFPARVYTLTLGERLAFKVGTVTFLVEFVRRDARMGKVAAMDWYFPRVFAISALLHVFFVVAAFITPETQRSLVDELLKNQNRFATMILKAPEKEKPRDRLDLSGMKGGAKHKGEEGKFGKKELPKKDALASKAGAPRVDPNKREKDRKIAMQAGLLGVLKGAAGEGAVSNVFGPGGLGTGINNAMGGLRGSALGDAGGAGGLGTRGSGSGGGGNSLGIGGLGTHGHGRGTGGFGNIDLGGKGKGTTRLVPGRTVVRGALSKEEIGRVIRRNLPRFKYCYEKQLSANPNLSGKVAVYFTVAPTGAVAQASIRESSISDATVEGCVATVMRSLKFPKPRGGGIVVVTYPFVFEST